MTAYHLVWRFVADPARQAEFEAAYAGNGLWAAFFRRGEGYLGTELLRELDGSPGYVTVDRWTSREAYEEFRRTNATEYADIDRRCAELTVEETFLGDGANVERYQRWFAYERDAHVRTLGALNTVPEAARRGAPFRRACGLLAHLAMARRLWLHRLGALDQPPAEFFPEGLSLDEVAATLHDTEARWAAYLARLTDGELNRVFGYRSQEGPSYENRVEDILTQLFGHSWYHRGQIALLTRDMGGEPAATDFVFWCRQPL